MIPIKINAKIKKIGNSYMVTIPKAIADLLDQEKEYSFRITEKEDYSEVVF